MYVSKEDFRRRMLDAELRAVFRKFCLPPEVVWSEVEMVYGHDPKDARWMPATGKTFRFSIEHDALKPPLP